jgi:hypothetical protein
MIKTKKEYAMEFIGASLPANSHCSIQLCESVNNFLRIRIRGSVILDYGTDPGGKLITVPGHF